MPQIAKAKIRDGGFGDRGRPRFFQIHGLFRVLAVKTRLVSIRRTFDIAHVAPELVKVDRRQSIFRVTEYRIDCLLVL